MTLITQLNDTLGNFPPFVEGVAPEKVVGYFGELDALYFDGGKMLWVPTPTWPSASERTHVGLAQFGGITEGSGNNRYIYGGIPTLSFSTVTEQWVINGGSGGIADNAPHVFTFILAQGELVFRIDGVEVVKRVATVPVSRYVLGAHTTDGETLTGPSECYIGPTLVRNDIDMPAIERMEDMLMRLAKIGPYAEATITAGSTPFEGDTLVGWAVPVAWPPSGVGSIEGVISSTAQVVACYLRTNPNLVEIILMGEVLSEVGGYTLQVDNAAYPVSEATFTLEQDGLTYIAWPADFPLVINEQYLIAFTNI